MAESETIITADSLPPLSESENCSTALPTTDLNNQKDSEAESEKKKPEGGNISLRIWPPTQKTRDAVVNRLIETLTSESILSKRYGTLQSDEALTVAKSIEDEAYVVASASEFGDDDGIEILKAYSKEISKRILDSVKTRTLPSPIPTVADSKADSTKDDDTSTDSVKLET